MAVCVLGGLEDIPEAAEEIIFLAYVLYIRYLLSSTPIGVYTLVF